MLEKFRRLKNNRDKRILKAIAALDPDSEYNKERSAAEEEKRTIQVLERIRESRAEYYDITFDDYNRVCDYMARHWRYLGMESDKTGTYSTFFGKKLRPYYRRNSNERIL